MGSSKDASSNYDQFFDITEFGGNLNLTIPRFLPPTLSKFASKNAKIRLVLVLLVKEMLV